MPRFPLALVQAVRQLRAVPGFTTTSILILALAIGVTTAVFTVVDNVLFQPVQLPSSGQLVRLCEVREADLTWCTASPPNTSDWQERARSFTALGLARQRGFIINEGGRRTALTAAVATPGFLRALGVAPLHGRLLQEDDGPPLGSGRAVLLGYETWQTRFGGSPDVVGSTIVGTSQGDGASWYDVPVRVVGVLPAGLRVPGLEDVEAWIPFQFDPRTEEYRDWRGFQALGRLAEGVTRAAAESELNGIQQSLAREHPDAVHNWSVHAIGLRDWLVRDARPLLQLFLAAVALVLLIAGVNLLSLQLARATARDHELNVRAVLGAGRARLAQTLLLESALLTLLGGIGGVMLALWLVDAFVAIAPPGVPRLAEVGLDARALAFACAVVGTLATAGGFASLSRVRALRMHEVLRGSRTMSADGRVGRLRNVLVSAQVALSLALVLSAALLMRSFAQQVAFHPGFDMRNLITFQVFPSGSRYETPQDVAELYARLERELAAVPAVVAVGTASAAPFMGGDGRTPFLVAGREQGGVQDAPTAEWFDAGPGFFPALGVPILEGRNLSDDDHAGAAPVAVINRAMAALHWPGASPIGAVVALPQLGIAVEIVGVVGDMRRLETERSEPAIFVSNRQRPRWATYYFVRAGVAAESLIPAVRGAFARLDAELEPRTMITMEQRLHARLVAPRFTVLVVTLFGVLAIVLTAFGLYAVIAHNVALRTREYGIRVALGAQRAQVLRSVLWDGGRLVLIGCLAGAAGAVIFSRLLRRFLYGIGPADPVAVAGTVVLLTILSVAASAAPALRALRVHPASIIRGD